MSAQRKIKSRAGVKSKGPVQARIPFDHLEKWTSVLKLSTMWNLTTIRRLAIGAMTPLLVDPVQKIVLARNYDVDEWLLPGLNRLVQRAESLSLNDFHKLGPDIVIAVAAIREGYQGRRGETTNDFTDKLRDSLQIGPTVPGVGMPSPW